MKSLAVEVRNPNELHKLFRKRADELAISRVNLDHLSGLPSGYCSTLLACDPGKRVSVVSLFRLLDGLGLSLVVIEDEKKLAAIAPWIGSRDELRVNRPRRRPATNEVHHG